MDTIKVMITFNLERKRMKSKGQNKKIPIKVEAGELKAKKKDNNAR